MYDLKIDETKNTPKIKFEVASGRLEIKGKSIPLNAQEFYRPILLWLDQYSANCPEQIILKFDLEYFNTASSKCILEILKKLKANYFKGRTIDVSWHYNVEDEGIQEAGEDFQGLVNIPMKFYGKIH